MQLCLIVLFSQDYFAHLPRQRHLSKTDLEATKTMLSVKADKKMLQHHIYKTSGKVVTLKDLHNMASDNTSISDANVLIDEMKKVNGKSLGMILWFVQDAV